MKGIHSKKLRAGALTACTTAALGLTLATTSSPADSDRGPAVRSIKMVLDQGPDFQGAQNIQPGQLLRIVNRTEVEDIGPHFFSLIAEGALPISNQEIRRCANIELPACEQVAIAHNVSRNFNVRRRDVERGQPGWNTVFTSDEQGDSWFTDQKGESETRVMDAEPGDTLYYLCVIHPQTMRGSIRVRGEPR